MAFNRMSVATISSPEFINIEGISPFVSKCEIKVLYLGENRNGSFINKEVATQMAPSLLGVPIVGYYSENADDFRDHGDQMIIDGDGVKFKCLTVPYGFVAPNARVWFQEFEDTDEFGNKEIRTYLMTEGYLWTEQYKEAQKVINEGRPQSMELDEKTLKGYWSKDNNRGIDFFIINDAIFSKLCILGEDVEPCFEGASVTVPKVSSTFSKDDKFTHTLYTMMNELKELISNNKGGKSMDQNKEFVVLESTPVESQVEEPVVESEVTPVPAEVEEPVVEPIVEQKNEKKLKSKDKTSSENNIKIDNNIEDFTKNSKDEDEDDKNNGEDASNNEKENSQEEEDKDKEEKKSTKNSLKEKFALIEQEYEDLKTKFASLEAENNSLKNFKADIEDKQKDELINSFYMLSDEDKKNVIDNKSKYTLDDIEKELSVICVRKKVNFNLDEEKETSKEEVPTTYNFQGIEDTNIPAWLKAVEARKNAE